MNKLKSIVYTALAFAPVVALAQSINIPASEVPQGITSFGGFLDVFATLISWIFTLLLVIAVIMILYAAFLYLTGGGNDDKIKKAHSTIIYAVIAIAVAFLAQGISFVVAELLRSGGAGT
ncbi:MAG: hypothetical protein COU06_00155 [Candidatus Harrisonbacteria bacterium CG10_big_fil_rev_8_21_14_0_10_38_8]|uniref:Uncharacterized protein n=1 Tax=Candidatus Harrisonbacteria bacterium CG10_big_fil_rev_8_21_14_0_10_38_8 TaxID=1974582 RepID=A0A2M6WKR2_9BACT|nr:MAG: hypothetical protein COU06_00155 [Candidatus Harrisonbacteria bacterium CG10_big_fil_rev_8_21_14_0_10_38_8]